MLTMVSVNDADDEQAVHALGAVIKDSAQLAYTTAEALETQMKEMA